MHYFVVLLTLFSLLTPARLRAQELGLETRDTQSHFQAVYINNFVRYVEWPTEIKSDNLVLGIVGEGSVSSELNKLTAAPSTGTRKLTIKHCRTINEADGCHLVYLTTAFNHLLPDLLKRVGNKPVLVITNKNGALDQGSSINFVAPDGKVRFEMNGQRLERARLKVPARLREFALRS